MRAVASALLFFFWVPFSLAAQHPVTVHVLSSYQGPVRGVGTGIGGGDLSVNMPCSQPFPDDATGVSPGQAGFVGGCTFFSPATSFTGTVQTFTATAILTTEVKKYRVTLYCQRQYGICPMLHDGRTYAGNLSEAATWLGDYEKRPAAGFMRVVLQLDGKHRVAYSIVSVAKIREVSP
jgi:hypothetical protein